MTRFTFPKRARLLKRTQFKYVEQVGKRFYSKYFIVVAVKNDLSFARLGVTVTKKIGNAPTRNWWKRRVREVFRLHQYLFLANLQIPQNLDTTFPNDGSSVQLVQDESLSQVVSFDLVVIVKRKQANTKTIALPTFAELQKDLLTAIFGAIKKTDVALVDHIEDVTI